MESNAFRAPKYGAFTLLRGFTRAPGNIRDPSFQLFDAGNGLWRDAYAQRGKTERLGVQLAVRSPRLFKFDLVLGKEAAVDTTIFSRPVFSANPFFLFHSRNTGCLPFTRHWLPDSR